jgi:histone demethylase JARID1
MHGSPTPTTPRGTPSRRGRSPRFTADSPSQSGSSTLPSNFPDKPTSTFTSSLNIRVEGATSFDSDSDKEIDLPEPEQPTTSESKRAPRKSKTEALAALNSHARSSSPNPDDDGYPDGSSGKDWNTVAIPVAPVLDMSSVKTKSHKIKNKLSRPFGLEDCPEFYPTMEEFKDPMAYIRSISDEAKNYGICKVVPPAEWTMPFVTDTEVRGLPRII